MMLIRSGRVTAVRDVHPENVRSPISVIPEDRVTAVNERQSLNASAPRNVTAAGSLMAMSPLPVKADFPMERRLSGSENTCAEHPEKAHWPISLTA